MPQRKKCCDQNYIPSDGYTECMNVLNVNPKPSDEIKQMLAIADACKAMGLGQRPSGPPARGPW